MSSQKRSRRDAPSRRDGGVAPRFGRKDLQLCRQISRTLSYVLGDLNDDVLRELYVESVVPAPDSSRVMVTVMPMGTPFPPVDVLTRLQVSTGRMRAEIASAISRKKVPELAFHYIAEPVIHPTETEPEVPSQSEPDEAVSEGADDESEE